MSGIRQAVDALEAAEKEARAIIAAARLNLGREILKARAADVPQKDIAAELKLTREQVRRLQKAAEDADMPKRPASE
jgi:DNA-binding Lrp family transcriptional regulator